MFVLPAIEGLQICIGDNEAKDFQKRETSQTLACGSFQPLFKEKSLTSMRHFLSISKPLTEAV